MANWTDHYVEGKFRSEADSKDGFPVRECRDPRERRLLEFLVPIVHLDKPTRVTRTIGNTIFGAISGERPVDWAIIFMELVNRLVGRVGKTKPTPICPFLYHLYESKGLLTEDEETDYTATQELNQYRITRDRDPESDSGVLRITGLEPQRVPALVNQVKWGNRWKQTHRASDGSPPTRSRGEGSEPNSEEAQPMSPRPMSPPPERPQPEQPEQRQELEQPDEEDKPWVRKPFDPVIKSYKVVKLQYNSMERFIEAISSYLDLEPADVLDWIKALPEPQDLTDLQARMDCLLRENGELRAKVEEGNALRKEIEELKNRIKAMEKEVKTARAERDKSKEVAQKVYGFLGNPGDILNKARLFDHGLKQPTTDSGVKIMRCMVDYGLKMEKTLKELCVLLQPTGAQPELVGTPGASPSTTPTPTPSPEFVTPPATQPDPLLQEPIPILNTEEVASLQNWAEARPGALITPTTRTGQNPGDLSTPGSASQEHQCIQEERTKRKADESVSESGSSEEEKEESPISLDSDKEEYQGSDTPYDPGKPETPPYQVNRPITRSTPRKKSFRSKRKAVQKQEQGSSSRTYKRRRG